MRKTTLLVFPLSGLLGLALIHGACTAGGGAAFDDDDDGSGQGGEGGVLLTNVGGSGNNTQACTLPSCVGNTPQGQCDSGLQLASSDAMDGARAIGLCQVAAADTWGVLEAAWVRSDGQPLVGGDGGPYWDGTDLPTGKGILTRFGNVIAPREGASMLGLSSGAARNPGDPDYMDPQGDWKDSSPHGAPPGYPKESPSCQGVQTGEPYDSAGLRLRIKTPTDAKSFTFDFDFYTYEYPDYICSTYNDFFVAMLTPKLSTLQDGNISFDGDGNTISVNAGFLQACQPCNAGGKNFSCPLGYNEVVGTGFDSQVMPMSCSITGSAATSWLVTTAPLEQPGSELTLLFAIWDSGDGVLDSTVLIDNFRFELTEGQVGTQPVPR